MPLHYHIHRPESPVPAPPTQSAPQASALPSPLHASLPVPTPLPASLPVPAPLPASLRDAIAPFSPVEASKALHFHQSVEGYTPTPLHDLPNLAARMGVAQVLVKDESFRFGLNAFKALGGSYAIHRYLSRNLDLVASPTAGRTAIPPSNPNLPSAQVTFVTATDGNHGRGVAWAARQAGHKAVVYLPEGSAPQRIEAIRAQGAQATMLDMNYDQAVRFARHQANRNGWVLLQDTDLPGYQEIPLWIMQGYSTIATEIIQQLQAAGALWPTHLFLQAGVGSFSGAMIATFLTAEVPHEMPIICIVEPEAANCLFKSAQSGRLEVVDGEMPSMMAGLCCGVPCTMGWNIIRQTARAFVSCPDDYAAAGMRVLGRPQGSDPAIVSGESGAVTLGVAHACMTDPALADLKAALGLNSGSRILCISTEGDTDPVNYQAVRKG